MKDKNWLLILGLILAVSAPAALSVTAYLVTKNPTLRPLARTEDDEAIYKGLATANRIIAHIRWTTKRRRNFTRKDLETAIDRAFNVHGVRVHVEFETVDTNGNVTITYQVGANTFGPHTITKAADSVNGAIAVYRMYKMGQKPAS